jgi:hypothetical protein
MEQKVKYFGVTVWPIRQQAYGEPKKVAHKKLRRWQEINRR